MKIQVRTPSTLPVTRMLKQREDGRPVYNLEADYPVNINGWHLIIRAGIHFDFASVPRPLWAIFPPADPDYAAASLIHDILYAGNILPRKTCDEIFRAAITNKVKAGIMYAAVRIGGRGPYEKKQDRKRYHVRRLLFGMIAGEPLMTRRPLYDEIPKGII